MAAHGDLAISFDYVTNHTLVFKRLSDTGNYYIADSRALTGRGTYLQQLTLSTNGNWIAAVSYPNAELLQLSSNGSTTSQLYEIYVENATGWLFPDNTFVALWPDAIRTYEFDGTKWNLTRTDVPHRYTALVPRDMDLTQRLLKVGPNFFSGFTSNSTFVYERHANRTWSLLAEIPTENLSGSDLRFVLYNGLDTIITTCALTKFDGLSLEAARIYTKNANDEWIMTQILYTNELHLSLVGFFPVAAEMITSDAFVLSAPFTNEIGGAPESGAIFWYERDDAGTWSYTRRISTAQGPDTFYFGLALAQVDNTVLSYQCNNEQNFACYLARADGCLIEPTNVTCHDQVSNSCEADINIIDYYTINTLSKCGTVEAHIDSLQATPKGIQLELRFTREGARDVTCTATKLCDRPVPPVSVSVPVSQPQASLVSQGTNNNVAKLLATFSVLAMLA